MAKVTAVNDNDSGLLARTNYNEAVETVETGTTISGDGNVGTALDVVPGQINTSELNNDANFIDSAGAPVQSVAAKTGAVTLDTGDVTAVIDKNYVTDVEKTNIGTIPSKADVDGATLTNATVNAVTLTVSGAATDYLDAQGNYTTPFDSGGDVVGPASAVDENIAVFNGATGKVIKDGAKNISSLVPKGQSLDNDSLLVGTPNMGALTSNFNTTGSTGYPTDFGVSWTFDSGTGENNRTFTMWQGINEEGNFWIRDYQTNGTPNTWLKFLTSLSFTEYALPALAAQGTEVGTTYTILDTDTGTTIYFDNVAGCTITLPDSSPIGTQVILFNENAVGITLAAETTLKSPSGSTTVTVENGSVVVTKKDATTWTAAGLLD